MALFSRPAHEYPLPIPRRPEDLKNFDEIKAATRNDDAAAAATDDDTDSGWGEEVGSRSIGTKNQQPTTVYTAHTRSRVYSLFDLKTIALRRTCLIPPEKKIKSDFH